ncbi:GSCOCG00000591001-RA-CDS [Cotesia congregata]|nr:GSCOCG00000591001-RA-CDS [Cotesia congregata]
MDTIKKLVFIILLSYFAKKAIAAVPSAPQKNLTDEFIKNLRNSFPDLQKKLNTQSTPTLTGGSTNDGAAGALAAGVLAKALGSTKGGTPKADDIPELIIEFLVKALIAGLKGLLTPIAILLIIILKVVEVLLNVVLWIVEALLKTLLTELGLGELGTSLVSTLNQVKDLVDTLLDTVEDLLEELSYIKEIEKTTGTRVKRAIKDSALDYAGRGSKKVGSTVYNHVLEPVISPFEPILLPFKMIFNFLNDKLFTDTIDTVDPASRRRRDTAQFALRQIWKGAKGGAKVGKFAGSTAISTATLPVTLPVKTALLPVKVGTFPIKKILGKLWKKFKG